MLYQGGDSVEAGTILASLLDTDPESAYYHYWFAIALHNLGMYDDAKQEIDTYVSLSGDTSDYRINALTDALGEGYEIDDAAGAADVKKTLEGVIDRTVQVQVEGKEGEPRRLVVTFDRVAGEEEAALLDGMKIALRVASLSVARIRPEVDQGAAIQVREKGKIAYTLGAGLLDLTLFGDGALGTDSLEKRSSFSRSVPGGAQASAAEIEAEMAVLRELEPKGQVPLKMMDRAELAEYVSSSVDEEAREGYKSGDAILTLLGVLTPEQDLEKIQTDLYTEQIVGFYDPAENTFYLVEDQVQSADDTLTLAHEYTHALQDQHFGLGDQEAADGDGSLAFDALVEGDATLAIYTYAGEHIGAIDFAEARSKAAGIKTEALDASPEFIRRIDLFPYEEGLTFVQALYASGGWEAVDEAYASPPQTTEQVLHPDRYRSGHKPQEVEVPDLKAALGGTWSEAETDVLGELGLRLALAQHLGPAAAQLAAEGWGGDAYTLMQKAEEGPYVLLIQTTWDDAGEADQFWALLQTAMAHRAGYVEKVKELLGVPSERWWTTPDGVAYARLNEGMISLVFAPDEATLQQVLTAMK
jgi:hypothetical protein